MTDKVDLVVHFRKVITQRYNLYFVITATASVIAVLCWNLSDEGAFLHALSYMASALFIGMLLRNHSHRYKMLAFLKTGSNDPLPQLENYLLEKQGQWQQHTWTRIVFGTITGLIMILLLVIDKDPYWIMTMTSVFIVIILAVITLSWINFNDQLLLHDIRRSHRDQPSNEPE